MRLLLLLLLAIRGVLGLTPAAGPASGGSIITVSAPASCNLATCAFGGAVTAAEIDYTESGTSYATCVSPSSELSSGAAVLEPDDTLSSAALFGTAIRDGDTVKLTREHDFDSIGTAVLPLPLRSTRGLRTSFELLMGRGTEGVGFSVSLARDPPVNGTALPVHVDERGVGQGLSVSFQTVGRRLVVAHNGTVLYTTPPIPKRTKVPQPDPGPPGPLCGKAPGGPGCEHPPSPPL